jgi:Tfp pilus assembly protein PilN
VIDAITSSGGRRLIRFGVDLGRAGVKAVRCDVQGVRGAERRLDANLAGEERHAALVQAVREVTEELGATPRDELHVAVPRAEAIVKRLTLPRVPLAEQERMVRFQAAKLLPFDLDEVVLTWTPLETEPGDEGQPILFAAVRAEALDALTAVILEAGFRPGSLEVSTQAAARSLVLQGGHDRGEVLLVEVGRANSDVIVLRDGRLVFSRSASVGCGDDPSASDAWLKRLPQEVLRSLVAARADGEASSDDEEPSGPPDALLLAGGGAGLEALHTVMAEQVGAEPAVLSALPGGAPIDGARFVVAHGLAELRQAPGVPRLDLVRRAQALEKTIRRNQVALGVGVALGLVLVAFVGVRAYLGNLEDRLRAFEAQRAALAEDVARADQLDEEMASVRAWDRLKGRELELLLAVTEALPEGERVYLSQLRWTEGRGLRLAGRAKDWDAVGGFLTRLEAHPLVTKASLDSVRKPRDRKARGVEWAAQADLFAPEGTP